MIQVSDEFSAAQLANTAEPAYVAYLIAGDYASSSYYGSTASSSGDDASGNFPAAGAINGDRTEINIGAASTADNGVGLSSWKSSTSPTKTSPVTLTINFNNNRTFNRIKLYNLSTDSLTSYILQYWNGASWVTFAGTPDQYNPPTPPSTLFGWGQGAWGDIPWGGVSWLGQGYTGKLDAFDLAADITASQIKLTVYATQSGGPAQVVEIEVYRKIDITNRIIDFKVDRKKDFKLSQPIATQLDLIVDNSDQFFSYNYSPTASQISSGFINSDLAALGLTVEMNEGFYTLNGIELIRTFTGSLDSISINASKATAKLIARDFTKFLINHQDSCKLKTSIDIGSALLYILNRNNVSTYETSINTNTGITLDYFFTFEQAMITTIQTLVQAAGDAIFFFDENGYATFQYFINKTPNINTTSGQTAWQAGTYTSVDAITNLGAITTDLKPIRDATGFNNWFNSTNGGGSSTVNSATSLSQTVTALWDGSLNDTSFYGTSAGLYDFTVTLPSSSTATLYFFFACDGTPGFSGSALTYPHNGNYFVIQGNSTPGTDVAIAVYNITSDVQSVVQNKVIAHAGGESYHIQIYINIYGNINIYVNDTLQLSGLGTYVAPIIGRANTTILTRCENNSQTLPATMTIVWSHPTRIWTSPSLDQGSNVSGEGILSNISSVQIGASITISTRTSPDNLIWSAYQALGAGGQIQSPTNRYIQVQIQMISGDQFVGGQSGYFVTHYPIIYSYSLGYYTGVGTSKYSNIINFTFTDDNAIIDVDEALSDNLAGNTAIINDIAITSAPLTLAGTATQTVWQGMAGSPPAAISGTNTLNLNAGTYTYNISISGGVDTSGMAGGSALVFTVSSGAATASITYVHPTKPVVTIIVTQSCSISDFRIIAKNFSSSLTPYQSLASDAGSIAKHRRRKISIANNYIVSQSIAGLISSRYITNFKNPISYIPKLLIMPKLNIQPGDQITVTNTITGISNNYYVVGYDRHINVSEGSATAEMSLVLLLVT